MTKSAVWEGVKFVLRLVVLVGIPTVLAEVIKQKPQWGVYIGIVLAFVDKVIHKLPNEYRGLVPF
jgi:hypothetical protein